MSISIVDTFLKSMLSRTLASNRWKCAGIDNMVLPLTCSPAKLLIVSNPADTNRRSNTMGNTYYSGPSLGAVRLKAEREAELTGLELAFKEYIRLLRVGEYFEARDIARNLESATYLLDPVWVEADRKNRGIN